MIMLPFDLDSIDSSQIEIDKPYDLGNGYHLILKQEYDDCTDINDLDCYGTIKWSRNGRPCEFDGSARIIKHDRYDKLWWLPYREGHTVYDDARSIKQIKDLVEYGFSAYTLCLYGPAQSITGEHTIKLEYVSICGIEPFVSVSDVLTEHLLPELKDVMN